jgi:peptide/nickel transport system substrate-binding protein
MKRHGFIWLMMLALIVVACSPAATTAPPAATTAPAPSVGQTPAAQVPPPTAVPAGPKRGGKVTFAMWQSPVTLNPLLGSQTVTFEVLQFVMEGMTEVLPDGTRRAQLAKEVPTVQNGGVSADGKTITYNLKEGVLWSDGKPLTCDDFVFYWQARMTPGVGVLSRTGYEDIETVECPSPTKVVVKFKSFFAPYLTLFNESLPKHYTGDPKNMKDWAYNRKPLGTGPFKVDEWVTDSHVTLSRNTNYREKDKPYLEQIVVRIVPSSEVAMQLLASGEIDIMWNNTEADLPILEKMQGVKISSPLDIGGERLFLNMAENKDPADPKKPHAILSDKRVRQAIAYGINKQRIVDSLLFGKAKIGTGELNAGYFDCKTQPYPYDSTKAKQLLEEAGWKPGADGIRAKDGQRLRLKYSTTSGNKLREDSQVLVAEDMKAIGVELFIENAPSSVVIGTWDGNSPRRRGNFDIIMYTTGAGLDPHSQMVNLWGSWMIPHEGNKGGLNYTRFNNPKADEILKQAAAEPDTEKRKALYCQLTEMTREEANMIYLYQRLAIESYRDKFATGTVANNSWTNVGWDAANWSLKDVK